MYFSLFKLHDDTPPDVDPGSESLPQPFVRVAVVAAMTSAAAIEVGVRMCPLQHVACFPQAGQGSVDPIEFFPL
jgi:hypothetical protein